ncbi:chemotaxis protein CheA [Achromobacter sp. K91]|uniref:Chemotaxis protein CheA n=1 Tax=Achromobacter aegrifaciens TaxID=1287736 RepID=A0ABU2DGK2_ACHAE|nr:MULTISPECIES: chemotaxis protein CheA [Achromobacter]MBD9428537.1 chemotaxis protein CheA [Achromobacter sp. ACM03]MDQ1763337.1 chemotaxis protein CheA [Achromobacter aegrifaciens]MDR7947247.1 chemotaxis protein CheA [Achromobacter aegrifaciens]RII99820.1 chemotaxis protein CheA [Achromobacter sp. K91]CAB3839609.1 Chemotaxis protein CheA [Achromobacter aegrifaciens]
MSSGLDLSQFYETFFDEADELLAQMEQLLLELDVGAPDIEQLNAIFRAAHSIKGGAATFGCFTQLAGTTHLLENLLDAIRRGEMALRTDMIDIFLETKDVLKSQLDAYRASEEPDEAVFERICAVLRQLALEHKDPAAAAAPAEAPAPVAAPVPAPAPVIAPAPAPEPAAQAPAAEAGSLPLRVRITKVSDKDAASLLEEMGNLGNVKASERADGALTVWMDSTCTPDDIEAVCCFIVDGDQLEISREAAPAGVTQAAAPIAAATPAPAPAQTAPEAPAVAESAAAAEAITQSTRAARPAAAAPAHADKESTSIRVGVEKVDQVINLVGELVITQAMLAQTASTLDPVLHDRLLNGMEQLERNARDLQEAVMSIRMMPMDYVFSRFPRLVRDIASKMGKQIELQTHGRATELDKSLIERIIDPLTHLVRNSLDHGIETPEKRVAAGKDPVGQLVLSAQHNGGNIVIEVSDDGGGLNRDKILKKAIAQGLPVNENSPDDEIWQLIFAPGFSTAEKVTDISGRGVGMDVVRRNIQDMGGHVQLSCEPGNGTTTRIVLPLTLAILDGMSVRVGEETFILPLNHVTESLQPTNDQIYSVAGNERVMHVRGEYLPLVEMHRVFSVSDAQTDPTQAIAVIMQAEDRRFALLVDHLIGQHQVVVKNLESNYRKVPGISAATILGDGSVALIVDVFALARANRERWSQPEAILN